MADRTVREPQTGNIQELADAIRKARRPVSDGEHPASVVFLIGAGCSVSAGVPTASDIAKKLVVEAAQDCGAPKTCGTQIDAFNWITKNRPHMFPFALAGAHDETRIDWSQVYDCLFRSHYSSNDDQRRIFGSLTDPNNIGLNWSHLCIGELVRAGLVGTILTTNFDQLVLEGLVAAGVLPVICDGFESLNRIVPNPATPQLVHIHGSRHAYRLRNHPDDVAEGASDPRIVGALTGLLQAASVFVAVGYGGREKGFMTALTEAALNFPDKPLYWVLYSSNPTDLGEQATQFVASSRNARLIVGQNSDDFFAELMKQLNLNAPLIIRDPLALASSQSKRMRRARNPDGVVTSLCETFDAEVNELSGALKKTRAQRNALEQSIAEAQRLALKGDGKGAFNCLLPYLPQLQPGKGAELLASILRDNIVDLPQIEARKALTHLSSFRGAKK